ncbi:hypothetical protein QWI18_18750 [Pseudomonas sp. W2Oct36]|uniref:hypothetical protein n=1 Tax=Pseudomonas sp. W2Oct36 TaxID=1215284 RepID=UPI0034E0D67D
MSEEQSVNGVKDGPVNNTERVKNAKRVMFFRDPATGRLISARDAEQSEDHALAEKEDAKNAEEKHRITRIYFLVTYAACVLASALLWELLQPSILIQFFSNVLVALLFVALQIAVVALIWMAPAANKKTSFIDADNAVQKNSIGAGEARQPDAKKTFKMFTSAMEVSKPDPLSKADVESATQDPFDSDIVALTDDEKFEDHMRKIDDYLESQIDLAERKASILLDKGTAYIRNGIFFYVATIVGWQILERNSELTTVAVLGMVSCSLTFLVIEFLAAWFLRQYRSFVDASTQLLRVKSIFNKYMLTYFGIKEFSDPADSSSYEKIRSEISTMLAHEIKWPETALGKNGDFNHMMEMFDSLTTFVDKAQKLVKPEKPAT